MDSTYTSHRHFHETANVRIGMRDSRRGMRCVVIAVRAGCCPVSQVWMSSQWPEQTSPDGKQSFSRSARKRGAREVRFEEKSDWRDNGYGPRMH